MSNLAFRDLADLCMSDFCTPLTRQAWEIIAANPEEFLRRLQGWPLFITDDAHGVKSLETANLRVWLPTAEQQRAYRVQGHPISVAEYYRRKGPEDELKYKDLPMLTWSTLRHDRLHREFYPLEKVFFVTKKKKGDGTWDDPSPQMFGMQSLLPKL